MFSSFQTSAFFLASCLIALFSSSSNASAIQRSSRSSLRVETFIHQDIALNMVSSLIIGSEAAIIIDMPLTISSAKSLNAWVKTKTSKPIVAAFSSHSHPDHYLSARTVLDAFPNATFYANPKTAGGIATAAPLTSAYWSSVVGPSEIVQNSSLPTAFPFSFFTLPGDSHDPIHLYQPLTGDTIDETLFWIPSSRTLITGDAVYGDKIHLFMADMLTPALTASWISTLDFLLDLNPNIVIPGHALRGSVSNSESEFRGTAIIKSTKKYLEFWQSKIEAKGVDFYTPKELYRLLDSKFPGRHGATSELLLNITVENFGRGGARFGHTQDLTVYTDGRKLDGWEL